MSKLIKVGISDYSTSKAPDTIITYGLGSCVGITLYDPVLKLGGLLHIMLPSSTQARNVDNLAKFADTGIPLMLEELISKGALKKRLVAKIAGGAQMFSFGSSSEIMNVGVRNTESVKSVLKNLAITIRAEDTGGTFGRTIELDLEAGKLKIRAITRGETEI